MSDLMRELAKEASFIRESDIKTIAKTKKSVKTGPVYELTVCEYPDFVITKTTSQLVKQLVIMPSQSAYYVKTSAKNKEPVFEKLTPEVYRSFMTGYYGEIIMPEDFWIHNFENTKQFGESLVRYFRLPLASELLCCGAAPKFQDLKYHYSFDNKWNEVVEMYNKCPTLFREFSKIDKVKSFMSHNRPLLTLMLDLYGLDCCKDFCKKLQDSLVGTDNCWVTDYRINYISPYMKTMQYRAFADYVLFDSVVMGYAEVMAAFFDDWSDTLNMQKQVYDKVKEKYPDNLPTVHMQLAYKQRKMQEIIDERNFARKSLMCQAFEKTVDDYIFIAPKVKQDFFDEATQQANCLASYVSRFANGESIIMFMRYRETPERSLVTIELSPDLEVRQKYQARNKATTLDQDYAIDKWLDSLRRAELLA